MPPVAMAAVGPVMLKTAARVGDSVRLHGFATRKYLEEVVRPMLQTELSAAGKSFAQFEVTGGGFIATGPDDAAVQAGGREGALSRGVLRVHAGVSGACSTTHGLGDLGHVCMTKVREGKWKEIAALVSDDVLDLFVARAPYEGIAEAIEQRFGGVVDTVTLEFLPSDDAAIRRRVIEAVQKIPHGFREFRTEAW